MIWLLPGHVSATPAFLCHQDTISWHTIDTAMDDIEKQYRQAIAGSTRDSLVDTRTKLFIQLHRQCIASNEARLIREINSPQQFKEKFDLLAGIAWLTHDRPMIKSLNIWFQFGVEKRFIEHSQIKFFYRVLVAGRVFEQARNLAAQYPNIEFAELPNVVIGKASERMLYQWLDDERTLKSLPFEFPSGGHVVVVSSPICGFCREFFIWLETQKQLKPALIQNTTWIIPADGDFHIESMQQTRRQNPEITFQYTYRQNQWPEITYWGTPTFYFYQDGLLKTQLVGWPGEEQGGYLRQKLSAIGILK